MLQFNLKVLLLLTAWLAVCLSLSVYLELNAAGILVAIVGFGLSVAGFLFGRLGRGIVAASALYTLCAVPALVLVGVGDGRTNITIQLVISDSNTKHPIDGASVVLHDNSAQLEPGSSKNPILVISTSDAHGNAIIVLELPLVVRTTFFTKSARVSCSKWFNLNVDRSGYEGVSRSLADLIGQSFKPTDTTLHVYIEMQPGRQGKVDRPNL